MNPDGVDPSTLAGLRAALEAATPRPWEACEIDFEHTVYSLRKAADPLAATSTVAGPVEPEDAELIVAAVNALPALLAEAEAAQKMRETLAQAKKTALVAASGAWALDHHEEELRWRELLFVLIHADFTGPEPTS